FTTDQLAWVEANEYNIWKEIVSNDKLFSKKPDDIGQFLNDGPFTSGFPRESPGHIGEWIGYRMVRSYMEENPKMTFAQLFQIEDPREILKDYKPK
ncbi:MAG: gliding motility lipoprotein GldB, partial [Bacteroidota bacterium]|nr:gliding motility lipoprotein GldB [Bacteroidota bacterium]